MTSVRHQSRSGNISMNIRRYTYMKPSNSKGCPLGHCLDIDCSRLWCIALQIAQVKRDCSAGRKIRCVGVVGLAGYYNCDSNHQWKNDCRSGNSHAHVSAVSFVTFAVLILEFNVHGQRSTQQRGQQKSKAESLWTLRGKTKKTSVIRRRVYLTTSTTVRYLYLHCAFGGIALIGITVSVQCTSKVQYQSLSYFTFYVVPKKSYGCDWILYPVEASNIKYTPIDVF